MTERVMSAPFAEYSWTATGSGIDYNGHLNDAAYAQVLTDANEMFLDALGLSADYRAATGCSMYTVEFTLKFLAEVSEGDTLTASTLLASHDSKRMRLHTTLRKNAGGNADSKDAVVATGDSLYLHVDTNTGRVGAFPDDRAAVLERVQRLHDAAPESR